MIVSQIAAMSRNRIIGKDNKLPWNMPDDLAYFFKVTRGHHIILGRKNFEAIGKALPSRVNIVVTRNPNYKAPGCIVVENIQQALKYSESKGEEEVFIVGGGQIYQASLGITNKIYLTIIDTEIEGDVFFPEFDLKSWNVISKVSHSADNRNPFNYTYYIFERTI